MLLNFSDNVRPAGLSKTNHKFEMHSFESSTSCNRCSKYLKGLIFQGYKCKTCSIAVHKECIAASGRCGVPPPLPPHSFSSHEQLADKLWYVIRLLHNMLWNNPVFFGTVGLWG